MKENSKNLSEVLGSLENSVSSADIISAMLLGKISAAITQSRLNLQMTQKEFADYLGVSQGIVSRWEGGDYNFTVKTLAELAEKLDLELDITLTGDNSFKFKVAKPISRKESVSALDLMLQG